MVEIKKQIESKVSVVDCIDVRRECQVLLSEKREHLREILETEMKNFTAKLDLILERQKENSERIDRFLRLNGDGR